MFGCLKKRIVRQKPQAGMTLIEVLVAMAILGVTAVVFLAGAATASKVVMVNQERVAAESLAKSQMEYIEAQAYSADGTGYQTTVPADLADQGYTIDPIVISIISGVDIAKGQQVTVTVRRNSGDSPLIVINDFKMNR